MAFINFPFKGLFIPLHCHRAISKGHEPKSNLFFDIWWKLIMFFTVNRCLFWRSLLWLFHTLYLFHEHLIEVFSSSKCRLNFLCLHFGLYIKGYLFFILIRNYSWKFHEIWLWLALISSTGLLICNFISSFQSFIFVCFDPASSGNLSNDITNKKLDCDCKQICNDIDNDLYIFRFDLFQSIIWCLLCFLISIKPCFWEGTPRH